MSREPITLRNLLLRARLQDQKICVTYYRKGVFLDRWYLPVVIISGYIFDRLIYFYLFIYLFSFALTKNVHNTSTTIHMHETEQEAGTPQQFTPITVGPLVKISDRQITDEKKSTN